MSRLPFRIIVHFELILERAIHPCHIVHFARIFASASFIAVVHFVLIFEHVYPLLLLRYHPAIRIAL